MFLQEVRGGRNPSGLRVGEAVTFDVLVLDGSPRAIKVYPADGAQPQRRQSEAQDPFTPQKPMADPAKFRGRTGDLTRAAQWLKDQKNILISGVKGIGKSSLAAQLLRSLREQPQGATVPQRSVLTGSFVSQSNYNLKHLLQDFLDMLDHHLHPPKTGPSVTMPPTYLAGASTADLIHQFFRTANQVKRAGGVDRVYFLVDEVQYLKAGNELSDLLKATKQQTDWITFLLSGTDPNAVAHDGRTEHLELRPMLPGECLDIIDAVLKESGLEMAPQVRERLAEISAGNPLRLHRLGSLAFHRRTENVIAMESLEEAIRDLIAEELRTPESELCQFREQMRVVLEDSYNSTAMKPVLEALAVARDDQVTIGYLHHRIVQHRRATDSQIKETLNRLLEAGILVKWRDSAGDSHKTVYGFADPLCSEMNRVELGLRRRGQGPKNA